MTDTSAPQGGAGSQDAFFVLRDSRVQLRDGIARIIEKVGTPRLAQQAFAETFDAAFDELVAAKPRSGFEAAHGLTASRISLVSESELEVELRIGGINKQLSDVAASALWRVHCRFMTLLKRREMAPDENPAGPETICRGLQALSQESGLKPEAKLELLGRIEAELTEQLPRLYGELNDLLAARNIAPAQVQGVSSGGARPASRAQQDRRPDPFAALQALMGHQVMGSMEGIGIGAGLPMGIPPLGGNAGAGGELPAGASMGASMGALGGEMFSGPGVGLPADAITMNAATLMMLNQLAERLDQLTLAAAATGAGDAPGAAPMLPGQEPVASMVLAPDGDSPPAGMPETIQAADIGATPGQPAAVAVDTLALIFSIIFETWDLPDTVKTAIGRLQAPLIKLAFFDASLFSDADHPARRLINDMARAASGLPRNLSRAHPVSSRLWQIAGKVKNTLQRDASVLEEPLAEVAALITTRNAGALAEAQPYVAMLREKEAREEARQAGARWLAAVEKRAGPEQILAFLRAHWLRVMETDWLEGGEQGDAWREDEATVTDLLASVQPKATPEERTALARAVPGLLRRLIASLERAGITAAMRQPFFDALFALQTAVMRGTATAAAAVTAPTGQIEPVPGVSARNAAVEDADRPLVELIEAEGRQLQWVGLAAAAQATGEAADVELGEWLEFRLEGDEPRCGLACWRNSRTGTLLIFNPDWGHAIALSAPLLARQMEAGQASIVSSRQLFDRAAEQALSRLQQSV